MRNVYGNNLVIGTELKDLENKIFLLHALLETVSLALFELPNEPKPISMLQDIGYLVENAADQCEKFCEKLEELIN